MLIKIGFISHRSFMLMISLFKLDELIMSSRNVVQQKFYLRLTTICRHSKMPHLNLFNLFLPHHHMFTNYTTVAFAYYYYYYYYYYIHNFFFRGEGYTCTVIIYPNTY